MVDKIDMLLMVLEQEITWCITHEHDAHARVIDEQYRHGFIAGLNQAKHMALFIATADLSDENPSRIREAIRRLGEPPEKKSASP